MLKADLIEIIGQKNGHTVKYIVSVNESESKLKVVVNFIAPELLSDLGPQYIAKWKTLSKSVEVPDSWTPHKIISKKVT